MLKVLSGNDYPYRHWERLSTVHDFCGFSGRSTAIAISSTRQLRRHYTTLKIAALAEPFYVHKRLLTFGRSHHHGGCCTNRRRHPQLLFIQRVSTTPRVFDEIVVIRSEFKDGHFIPSDRPGIGIELDEKQLRKYAMKGTGRWSPAADRATRQTKRSLDAMGVKQQMVACWETGETVP